jgi:hypothetical protein
MGELRPQPLVDSQIFRRSAVDRTRILEAPCSWFVLVRRHLEASKWWNGLGACGWVSHTRPRGPREILPGPIMWVRPATGWWGRMNAGESPRNQGRSVCRPPLSVFRRRSRGLRKNAAVERREANALRHWACAARRLKCYPRLSALRSPHACEGAFPLVSEGMEMPGAPRALREQGRRSFDFLCTPAV